MRISMSEDTAAEGAAAATEKALEKFSINFPNSFLFPYFLLLCIIFMPFYSFFPL